jgi:hypothetical protein
MVKKIYILVLILGGIGLLSLPGCVDEVDIERENISDVTPKEIITSSIYGKVIDESNQVMENVEVVIQTAEGEQSTSTNEWGQFEFFEVRVKGASAFLKVSAPGKFDGFRRAAVIKNKLNYTQIKMLDREIVGTIDAQSGGSVSTSSGAQVRLPSNAVVTQNGQTYAGSISVAMQWIDPTAEDLHQRLVGDLSGIDIEGQEVALGTFGMMTVELLDNQGNELQLADEARAELTWPIPSERLSEAPQSIPVWSYDENLGTWIEEELAIQNGNTFTGEVSHFSSWNLDWKGPNIEVSGRVTFNGSPGNILTTFRVEVSSPLFGSRGGFLANDGEFLFLRFPADEVFTLSIYNICGDVIYEETYGPFNQNTDLGAIDITNSNVEETTVSGVAVDCDMNPIENALVRLEFDSNSYYLNSTNPEGTFEFTVPFCGNVSNGSLFIIDPDELLVSTPQNFTISASGDIDLGNILVCDQATEFFQFTIDTIQRFFTPPDWMPFLLDRQQGGDRIGVEGPEFAEFWVEDDIDGTGSYTSNFQIILLTDGNAFLQYSNTNPPDLTVEITEYSDIPGEYIGGTFSGTMSLDSVPQGPMESITGAFRIEVDQ